MALKKTFSLTSAMILTFSALSATQISADESKMSVFAKFESAPEGVCIDSKGTIFATIIGTGEVVELEGNIKARHIAWVPSKEDSGKGLAVGCEADNDDNILIAYTEISFKYFNLFNPRIQLVVTSLSRKAVSIKSMPRPKKLQKY